MGFKKKKSEQLLNELEVLMVEMNNGLENDTETMD